jgi:hypothetical protein
MGLKDCGFNRLGKLWRAFFENAWDFLWRNTNLSLREGCFLGQKTALKNSAPRAPAKD